MENKVSRAPVPNHIHGKVTDINLRLKDIRNSFNRVLARLRPDSNEQAQAGVKTISYPLQDKLLETGDLVHELEVIAREYEDIIGVAEEEAPTKARNLG